MADISAKRPQMNSLRTNCYYALIIHSISVAGLSIYLLVEALKDDTTDGSYNPV